ncbi:lipopolysaccharide biosynthesis protein [Desulfobacter curvatus]|uniref:lipopolysaccharide biosynthesis protein n=1 Tax=Desulfobacter curvatus TaxID=2290 RepID=UPI00039BC60C|nr:hypothetical protein [Desulfobacter curvatus]
MTPSQRLILNTIATYTRSILALGFALFSSRWVLNALGKTDFGLFSVVGSIIIFITFLNGVMAGSVSRYFAYSIGQGDSAEVKRWFNAALSIHLCFAIVLILFGWPIGEYTIKHMLTVPDGRIQACTVVFRVSLISAFVNMLSVPFIAMFRANQRISEMAVWGMLQTGLTFALAYLLTHLSGDLLLVYAVGMVVIIVFIQLVQVLRAFKIFNECRIELSQWFDKSRFKKIASFAIWNLIGGLGATLRDQGSAILLNLYFGPNVNAAYGIGKQVSAQTNQLATAMMGAFSPEITSSEGRGDRERMISLSLRASKFGTLLVFFFAIPLMIEMDYVLKLWLRIPPSYTAIFCRLIIASFIIDRLSSGYMLAVNAHGRIAAYQATLGTTLLLTLPLAWLFLKMGHSPASVCVAFVITMTICSLGRVFWGKYLLGIPIRRWIRGVLWPSVIVSTLSALAGCAPYLFMHSSFIRLLSVVGMTIFIAIVACWFIALDQNERMFVVRNFKRLQGKFYPSVARLRAFNDLK